MNLFKSLNNNTTDINDAVAKMQDGDVLLDVREADEYAGGHIPGALNYPLSTLAKASIPWEKDTVLLVYCLSGVRSGKAVQFLKSSGYINARNIGGISSFRGEKE